MFVRNAATRKERCNIPKKFFLKVGDPPDSMLTSKNNQTCIESEHPSVFICDKMPKDEGIARVTHRKITKKLKQIKKRIRKEKRRKKLKKKMRAEKNKPKRKWSLGSSARHKKGKWKKGKRKKGMGWNGKWKKGRNKKKMMNRRKKKRRNFLRSDVSPNEDVGDADFVGYGDDEYMNVYDDENLDDQKIEAQKDENVDVERQTPKKTESNDFFNLAYYIS